VVTLSGYSAHADRGELRQWVRKLGGPIRRAFVVHGEAGPSFAMAQILQDEGVEEVIVPKHGESFPL
jgi:metallo-beta-lactamase family protein